MAKLKIKNDIFGRYDNIKIWINDEKYYLKPNSEITTDVYGKKTEIIFSIYFSKSKKIVFDIDESEEVLLKLKYKIKFYILSIIFIILFLFSYFLTYNFFISYIFFGIPYALYCFVFISRDIELINIY